VFAKKEKAELISQFGRYLMRRRPTLPRTFARSTIGPAGLNFRVRDGNGWNPRGKITANLAVSSWLNGWNFSMRGASQVLHRVARKGAFTWKDQAYERT
jgi:hypothetical protein